MKISETKPPGTLWPHQACYGTALHLPFYIPLYGRLHKDGDLSLKRVNGFMFMDKLQFCTIYAHIKLVCIND